MSRSATDRLLDLLKRTSHSLWVGLLLFSLVFPAQADDLLRILPLASGNNGRESPSEPVPADDEENAARPLTQARRSHKLGLISLRAPLGSVLLSHDEHAPDTTPVANVCIATEHCKHMGVGSPLRC